MFGLVGIDLDSRPSLQIAAATLAVVFTVWLIAVGAIWRSHTMAVREATSASQTLAVMAAAFTSKSIAATDLILKSMLDWVSEEGVEDSAQYERVFSERRYFDKLRDRVANIDQIDVATFIATSGRLLIFTRSYPPPPINLADRDYFKAQAVSGAPPTSLGTVVQNRGTGRWTFYLARQVLTRSGTILGVVIVGIEADYLADFYRQLVPGEDVSITFWRDDGTVLATSASKTEVLGKRFPGAVSARLLLQHPEGGTEYLATPRLMAASDETPRLLTARPVLGVPGYVTASVGASSFLASWRTDRNGIVLVATLLTLAVGIASQQSQRARREVELRRHNELEQDVLHAVVDMPLALTAVLDSSGNVLRSNGAFDSFFRRTGRSGGFNIGEVPEAAPIAQFALGASESVEEEIRLSNPAGDQRIIRFAMAKQDLRSWGRCSVIIGTDETAHHSALVAIAQSSKMITLGEMATGMAHELNQPINIIHMAAQNALGEIEPMEPDDPVPEPTPELLEFLASKLKTILSQTARAASLITHMRVFGRAPREAAAPFDVRDVCTGILDLVGQQVRIRGIVVNVDPGPRPAMVLGHQTMLEQVLLNVVLNARDALLAVSDGEKRIGIRCRVDDRVVVIEVDDNGPGIPESIRGLIFDPFFTTKEVGQGTGLGLAFSYGIIRDMKGSISVAPSDIGARIRIELPVAG